MFAVILDYVDDVVIDLVQYLAYGSNLHPVRLKTRVPSASVIGIVPMPEKRLAFHKKSKDGSGKCNFYDTGNPGDMLYTVLYEFDFAEKGKLDRLEGKEYGYKDRQIDIECNRKRYEGVFIYGADPAYLEDKQAPNHEYKEMVLLGAKYHDFPADYITRIEAVASFPNPDPVTRVRDEKILVKMRGTNVGRQHT